MSAPPYMQFYIGDYLKDTTELTTTQHGAYLLLLFAMWSRGGYLPDDDAKLSKIAGLRLDQWRKMRPQIQPFFRLEGGRLTQGRLLEELEAALEKRTLNRANGAHGGKANAKKYKARRVANATVSLKQPEPEPDREINLSAPSGAERDLSLWSEAQARFRSPDGERACAPVLRLVTEKGPSEGSQTDGPAWMAKRPSEMTPEERLLAKAYVEAQRNG